MSTEGIQTISGYKNHGCKKEVDFSKIDSAIVKLQESMQSFAIEIGGWKFFKGVFLSVLGCVLIATVGAIYQFAKLQKDMEEVYTNQKTIIEIKKDIDEINLSLSKIEEKLK
jgi:hypothetical protein